MSILCAIPLIALLFACSKAPKVNYETVKITKSIDCEGKAYNQGKITELQITTSNVTVKRCKINGSIRTIGLGRNGEAAAVKESSIKPLDTCPRMPYNTKVIKRNPECLPTLKKS